MALEVRKIAENFERPNNPLLNRSHRIKVQAVATARKWTPVFIWAMTKADMAKEGVQGQTACFHVLLSTQGPPIWNGKIEDDGGLSFCYGWDGQELVGKFEKQWPEPHGNFVMGAGAEYWVKIQDEDGVPSDTVTGITLTNREDESDPFAHHTTLVIWQLQDHSIPMVVDPRPEGGYATVPLVKLREAQKAVKAAYDALMAMG